MNYSKIEILNELKNIKNNSIIISKEDFENINNNNLNGDSIENSYKNYYLLSIKFLMDNGYINYEKKNGEYIFILSNIGNEFLNKNKLLSLFGLSFNYHKKLFILLGILILLIIFILNNI